MLNKKQILKNNVFYKFVFDKELNLNYHFIVIKRKINQFFRIDAKVEFTNKVFSKSSSLLDFMKKHKYLVGINGGIFNTSTLIPECLLIKNSKILIDKDETYIHKNEDDGENKRKVLFTLAIKQNGNIKSYNPKLSAKQIKSYNCTDALFGFGPLVLKNKIFPDLDKVVPYGAYKKKPRQIICMTKQSDYVIITIDSPGATYEECRQLVKKYNFPFAFALDGGSSTQTVIGRKLLTPIYREKTGRKIPTIIVFDIRNI